MKRYHYSTKIEFIREALREKMKRLEEQGILNDPDLITQLKENKKIGKTNI